MKRMIELLLNGGILNGKKTLIGVLLYFGAKWFPEIPGQDLELLILPIAEFMVKWGLVSKAYKLALSLIGKV